MDTLSIVSFLGFTLMVAVIAWYATRKTDENSAMDITLAEGVWVL